MKHRLFRRAVLLLSGGVLALVLWAALLPHAFAAGLHAPPVQSLTTGHPSCSGRSCNGQDPYATGCAGQNWDSWKVVTSDPVRDNSTGEQVGWVQLWWSETCQTNWGRVVPLVGFNWASEWTGLSNKQMTPLSNIHPLSPQLYAPVLLACTQTSFQMSNEHLATGASGQFRRDWESCY